MIYGAKTLSSLVRTNEVGKALALGQGNCGFVGTGMFCRGTILARTKPVKITIVRITLAQAYYKMDEYPT